MQVLITGDRDWEDERICHLACWMLPSDAKVIHGAARGADSMMGKICENRGLSVHKEPAKWEVGPDTPSHRVRRRANGSLYDAAAGPIRNRVMLDMEPDVVFCFHNDLDRSKGTKDCVDEAIKRGIPVIYFTSDLIDDVLAHLTM